MRRPSILIETILSGWGTIRFLIRTALFLGLLLFNVLAFTFAPIADAMMDLARRLSLSPAVAPVSALLEAQQRELSQKQKAARLEEDLDLEKRRSSDFETRALSSEAHVTKLQTDVSDLKNENLRLEGKNNSLVQKRDALQKQLQTQKIRTDQAVARSRQLEETADALSSQVSKLESEVAKLKPRPIAKPPVSPISEKGLSDQIDKLTVRVIRRSSDNAARNIASMALEAVPVLGPLTIVSVTALEISDACQTAKDMEKLRELANLGPGDPGVVQRICGMIPSLSPPKSMTVSECRAYAKEVKATLGEEAARSVEHSCDCLEMPDTCPDEIEPARVDPLIPY